MKKILALMIAAILTVCCFAGCSSANENKTVSQTDSKTEDTSKLRIVTTIFPEYDWVREILGDKIDHAELTLLLDNGVDLHNYQPTADDIMKISSCDMFIYVGGESDEWVDDALQEATNKDMVVIDLLDVLGDSVKEEEVKEGMQGEDEEDEEEGEEEIEYDEHVWLSLKNAKTLCSKISHELCNIDSENSDTYKDNVKAYNEKLDQLDSEYQSMIDSAKTKTLIFGDRFPFRYLVDDYRLDYFAAFVGCSAETEASFETIIFLANKVDELDAGTIFTIENSDKKIAETIKSNTQSKNQNIAELNSLQSVTSEQVNNGTTYMSIMQNNYNVLKEAIG
ncbi:MAG: zinc ABC transporter substrate-binding protein [Clostridia bacterium]|nr:zinc ABC transporter substrate-binding protein [Clostridia bacterium]MBR2175810.1 zinc ABC transporter substrate-binding protein [Clostridia bacterium]